jgi:hypothetical protein
MATNAGARPGDVIILTKADRHGRDLNRNQDAQSVAEVIAESVATMLTPGKYAAEAIRNLM